MSHVRRPLIYSNLIDGVVCGVNARTSDERLPACMYLVETFLSTQWKSTSPPFQDGSCRWIWSRTHAQLFKFHTLRSTKIFNFMISSFLRTAAVDAAAMRWDDVQLSVPGPDETLGREEKQAVCPSRATFHQHYCFLELTPPLPKQQSGPLLQPCRVFYLLSLVSRSSFKRIKHRADPISALARRTDHSCTQTLLPLSFEYCNFLKIGRMWPVVQTQADLPHAPSGHQVRCRNW